MATQSKTVKVPDWVEIALVQRPDVNGMELNIGIRCHDAFAHICKLEIDAATFGFGLFDTKLEVLERLRDHITVEIAKATLEKE
jgi:putative ubiquitin-RnfH superfamily antitoxin RatB of RatAB toxin-antitoxin module